jgi:hypothetical protein
LRPFAIGRGQYLRPAARPYSWRAVPVDGTVDQERSHERGTSRGVRDARPARHHRPRCRPEGSDPRAGPGPPVVPPPLTSKASPASLGHRVGSCRETIETNSGSPRPERGVLAWDAPFVLSGPVSRFSGLRLIGLAMRRSRGPEPCVSASRPTRCPTGAPNGGPARVPCSSLPLCNGMRGPLAEQWGAVHFEPPEGPRRVLVGPAR